MDEPPGPCACDSYLQVCVQVNTLLDGDFAYTSAHLSPATAAIGENPTVAFNVNNAGGHSRITNIYTNYSSGSAEVSLNCGISSYDLC